MYAAAVLYLAPVPASLTELELSVERSSWLNLEREREIRRWTGAGEDLRFEACFDPLEAAARTRARHYSLAVVDCRQVEGVTEAQAAAQEQALHSFLDRVRDERDPDRRFPFERIAVLVGGRDLERSDRLVFDAGAHHVGICVRDRSLGLAASGDGEARKARARFLHELWDLAHTVVGGRKLGVTALCAAGGGITGIYYELGVLKCLEDSLVGFAAGDFDMYFGISAGAVVSSLLANQMPVDELIARFGGDHSGSNVNLEIDLGLRHLNWRGVPGRVQSAVAHLRSYISRVRAGKERFTLTNLGWQLAALAGPLFDASEIERRFARYFAQPGRSNDFRRLAGGRLYIGATDQDAREHVLFGDDGLDQVPISKAVQASSAIHPFFRSVEIEGRYYTDGFVTRTSNLHAAIDRGANLVFVIDPFLPLVTSEAGEAARHGLFWGVLQDYKTVAYTRFERVSDAILRQNPQVTCFTFVPSNRMRRLMGTNPMAGSYFDAIVVEAYRSTYRRFRRLQHIIGPRLAEHGIQLDLSVAARTVARLERRGRPTAAMLLDASARARVTGATTTPPDSPGIGDRGAARLGSVAA